MTKTIELPVNKQETLYLPVKKEGFIFSTDDSECKRYYRTLDGEEVSSSFKAKSKEELLDQLKPVVPKFVAEWIDELKKSHSNLAWVWQVYPNEPKVKNWLESNTEKFMRAWLDGYEVEKEQLYTVEIPDPYGAYKIRFLFRNRVGNILIGGSDNMDILLNKKTHLTESEIKQDFEWAWDAGFAKEVE